MKNPNEETRAQKLNRKVRENGTCPYHVGAPIASMVHSKNEKHFCFLCQNNSAPTRLSAVTSDEADEQTLAELLALA